MIVKLPLYGSLSVQGIDAKKFLQGQLTCDLDQLEPNQSCMGAHCNPKGRIISLFQCLFHDDTYRLIMLRDMLDIAQTALKKYALFFKVTCINSSDEYFVYGITIDELSNLNDINKQIVPLNHRLALMLTTRDNLENTTNTAAWDQQLIQEKIPCMTPDISQQFLAHELHLNAFNAISFEKGCYTGQEIIARMHYRSQLTYRLITAIAQTDAPITAGIDVYTQRNQSEQIIGNIINVRTESPESHQLLMTIKDQPITADSLYLKLNDNKHINLKLES